MGPTILRTNRRAGSHDSGGGDERSYLGLFCMVTRSDGRWVAKVLGSFVSVELTTTNDYAFGNPPKLNLWKKNGNPTPGLWQAYSGYDARIPRVTLEAVPDWVGPKVRDPWRALVHCAVEPFKCFIDSSQIGRE